MTKRRLAHTPLRDLTEEQRAAMLAHLEKFSKTMPAPQHAYTPGKNPFTRRARA